jgi:hypothetical protein
MTLQRLFLALVPGVLVCGTAMLAAEDELRSGPQAGQDLPGSFRSVVAYSAEPDLAGKRNDFIEQYGSNPVVLAFARELTTPVTALVKTLDAEIAKRNPAKLRAAVVMLSADDALERKLVDFCEEQPFQHVHLAIMEPNGPKDYKLSKEAEVTVILYNKRAVTANHAYRKGELNDKAIATILADAAKMIPRPRLRREP